MFDFAENLIAQQRVFAKQMLRAAGQVQQTLPGVADSAAVPTSLTDAVRPGVCAEPDNAFQRLPGRLIESRRARCQRPAEPE